MLGERPRQFSPCLSTRMSRTVVRRRPSQLHAATVFSTASAPRSMRGSAAGCQASGTADELVQLILDDLPLQHLASRTAAADRTLGVVHVIHMTKYIKIGASSWSFSLADATSHCSSGCKHTSESTWTRSATSSICRRWWSLAPPAKRCLCTAICDTYDTSNRRPSSPALPPAPMSCTFPKHETSSCSSCTIGRSARQGS